MLISLFFFNDTATTEIYTLSLHDALPISARARRAAAAAHRVRRRRRGQRRRAVARGPDQHPRPAAEDLRRPPVPPRHDHQPRGDRKSTRLNSSHANISYAVFCLKKKKKLK